MTKKINKEIKIKTKKTLSRILNKKVLIIFGVILLLVGGYFFIKKGKSTITYDYGTVSRGDIQISVEGSGNISTAREVDIKTQSSGQLVSFNVKPGDSVKKSQVIGQLDSRNASIQVAQAKANYDKIINGITTEDSIVAKTTLDAAKKNLDQVKQQQENAVTIAKRNLLNSNISAEPVDGSTINSPTVSGVYNCEKEGTYTIQLYPATGSGYSGNVSGLETGTLSAFLNGKPASIGTCGLSLVFDPSRSYGLSDKWQITIPNKLASSYGSNYNSYTLALQNKDNAIATAEQNLASAQASFDQKVSHARPEDVAVARASLNSAYLAYDNTLIKAPFSGIIGSVSVQAGEQVSSGTSVASLATTSKIADLLFNEVDITKIKIGQKVDLTFDAIPDLTLPGTVSEIDTLGTQNQNVVSFKVRIVFDGDDDRVKSGMSVTARIITEEKKDTLVIPSGALKTEKGKTYVLVPLSNDLPASKNTQSEKIFVETGITNDTQTEILSGLTEGQRIIVRTIQASTSKTTSSTSTSGRSQGFGGGGGGFLPR